MSAFVIHSYKISDLTVNTLFYYLSNYDILNYKTCYFSNLSQSEDLKISQASSDSRKSVKFGNNSYNVIGDTGPEDDVINLFPVEQPRERDFIMFAHGSDRRKKPVVPTNTTITTRVLPPISGQYREGKDDLCFYRVPHKFGNALVC